MYVGRLCTIGMSPKNEICIAYRVSSRSYQNREAKVVDNNSVAIVSKDLGTIDSPFITYNCLKTLKDIAIVSNGNHTDYLALKIDKGYSMRDAMASVLLAMDYEHDSLNTPRIVAMVDKNSKRGYLGIVREDTLQVQEFVLEPGKLNYIATYEQNYLSNEFCDKQFNETSAISTCKYILGNGVFKEFQFPVASTCAFQKGSEWEIDVVNL